MAPAARERTVTIVERGRDGQVTYRDGPHELVGYWEFGGGDVVAVVAMGSADDWRARHAWAVDQRAEILRVVADEVIRQRAPSCAASIDEATGDILLRQRRGGAAPTPTAASRAGGEAWVRRYGRLKGWLAVIGLAAVLVVGATAWLMSRVFVVQPGKGVPFGRTVRTDTHLATLIDRLQPYMASLHHDPSMERRSLGLFLVPLDGSPPRLIPLVRELRSGSYSLARVIGSDGRRMWVDVNGLAGVDLRTDARVTEADVARANPGLGPHWIAETRGPDIVDGRLRLLAHDQREAWALDPATLKAAPVPPRPVAGSRSDPPLSLFMGAGLFVDDDRWLGLQSTADLSGAYRPGRWLRPVESATDTPRETRRLTRGDLGPASSDDTHRQIRAMTPLDAVEYRNASFLRVAQHSEPLRMANPDSVLMLHTSAVGTGTRDTLLVSRVEVQTGRVLWTHDTGLDRFTLAQILPAATSTAFVGTRPPLPDRLSEPLIVVVDHATGRLTPHSLWR